MRKYVETFFCITIYALTWLSLLPAGAPAQSSTAASPQFEVSSVKQNNSLSDASNISSSSPDRFVATNVPARFLILYAYDLLDHQLVGAPDWTLDKPYDVIGTYPAERRPADSEIRIMLQNLLADRFALKLHHEQRELPAYDLVVVGKDGRIGPQLHKSDFDCAAWTADKGPKTGTGTPSPVSPTGKRPQCAMIATRKYLTGGARTMQDLARTLQSMLSKPIVDRTGLTGAYDIDLQWASMELEADATATVTSSEGPSLFTALKEQLGLKLIPHKETFDVFVVDEMKPPGPN
jgi:uncharacterized protein (TIGR03435 family)